MLRPPDEEIWGDLTDLCSLKPAGPSSSSLPLFLVLFHSANIVSVLLGDEVSFGDL
jgi:hypothetical protein